VDFDASGRERAQGDRHPDNCHASHEGIFRSYFVRCLDIGEDGVLSRCVRNAGLPWQEFEAARAMGTPAELLRRNVDDSLQQGVFGSPFFIVDGEPFFGVEKLPAIEEWLISGGW
jgi:2-hydroxychromene-2-carboxylate isomerase